MLDETTTDQLLLAYKKNQAIRKLARSGAHAYNNIFAGLSGQLGMLLKDGTAEKTPERKELIEDLLQRGIHQTELLYDFCLERRPGKKSHSAGRIADRAADFLNGISREHVFQSVRPLSLPRVVCNFQDIVLLLFYLGENAIDSMSGSGTIILRTEVIEPDGAARVCFSMIDTGQGISEKTKGRIFHSWSAGTAPSGLSGLGLFAVGRIAADHGGVCSIDDRDGGGCIVSVELVAEETGALGHESLQSAAAGRRPGSSKKHVFLVVDDEESMRRMLQERLRRRGHEVFCAQSCAEAVEKYRCLHEKITCIVLDIRLEDSRGIGCAERLRHISSAAAIVFMSGIDNREERGRFASFAFLKKPFSIEQLEHMADNDNS